MLYQYNQKLHLRSFTRGQNIKLKMSHVQQYEYHSPEHRGYEQPNSYTIDKYHIHEELDKAPKTKFQYYGKTNWRCWKIKREKLWIFLHQTSSLLSSMIILNVLMSEDSHVSIFFTDTGMVWFISCLQH